MKPVNCFLNRLKLAGAYYRKRHIVSGSPTHIKIELTNYCNLSCTICPHAKMKRKIGFMDFSLYKDIIDQTSSLLEFTYLHFMGESLFHKDIEKVIRYGKEKGVAIGLSTNATRLDRQMSELLIRAGLDFMVISFDGVTKASYEAIRKNSNYEETLENIKQFSMLKNGKKGLTAVLQLIKINETDEEIKDIFNIWQGYVMIKKPKDWAGHVSWLTLPKGIATPTFPTLPFGNNGIKKDRPCSILWNELSVLWDGRVVICSNDFDGINMVGDANTSSIKDIWNGDNMQRMRLLHATLDTNGLLPCSNCSGYGMNFIEYVSHNQLHQRRRTYLNKDTKMRAGIS